MSQLTEVLPSDRYKSVRAWLWFVAFLVFLMVIVGGATRMTGSGLSITEWRPVSGALPPLSDAAWMAEFERYRQIPQYLLVNKGMSLGEFKFIYWWEWGHRQLGRFVGFAYMLPLLVFLVRRVVTGKLALWLIAVGLLGGFQGAIGWIMVASGLKAGMTAVAPVKLALHLTTACIILACLIWTARALRPQTTTDERASGSGAGFGAGLVVLLLVQIALGALVAGSKSGLTYNTWPLIDGALVPSAELLFIKTPWLENFASNPALVQFNHRMTAYLLLGLAVLHAWRESRKATPTAKGARHLAYGIGAQAVVGIVTLLLVVPIWAGLLHQALAALLLGVAAIHAEAAMRTRRDSSHAMLSMARAGG
jgi:heme a synthase